MKSDPQRDKPFPAPRVPDAPSLPDDACATPESPDEAHETDADEDSEELPLTPLLRRDSWDALF